MTGETPLELARRLRLERAAWQLSRTAAPVTDIAFDAGYETHEAFTRAFRAAFGTSPTGFREKRYRRTALAAGCGIHYATDGGTIPQFIARVSGGQHMDVTINDMPELRVASLRHIGPYNQISQTFAKLGEIAGRAGLFREGSAMIGLYHDDPETTPPEELRSDAGITVTADMNVPGELQLQTLPAGRYARAIHRGGYEHLGDTWAQLLGEWLPAHGHRLAATPSYELYRNTPMDTSKDQLVTEIYIPLA
jgi:AraC family transcriptional regulator